MAHAENTPGLERLHVDPFLKDLRVRVNRYFKMTRQRPRDCPRMYVKSGIILSWGAASYVALVFLASSWWQGVLASVSMALSMAAIGFNIQHDGSHRAYSSRLWVNRLTALSLDLMGASSYIWARKHNTFHHTYTNITGHDDDISLGPLGRLSPHQKRLRFHRFQHFYLWFFYGFITLKWQLVDDYKALAQGRIGAHRIARPRGRALAVFIAGKAVSLMLALIIPALVHPLWVVLVFYAVTLWLGGIVLSVVFQLAHIVREAEFPQPEEATEALRTGWAVHQIRTTVDFARHNRLLTWFLGGLNFQVEHHLFPRICHVHYPRLSRMVENACRRAGVPYSAHGTLRSSIRSHFQWLREMGEPPRREDCAA